ncbi:alpha/beta hydrolase-fold protein [Algoriphagus limi]|uniref:Alpha/beta hydrolase-fold protein n=1 Tax=Algoriphagus limi TaxID=2975273 RepID=A0ABT2G435_9BACT|nr:alpha/beta hydrolase-fold protein [Algoriphagus limi]MCS5489852.1 alpha/beta hydrolase-fold protein [Algoriphagus limi]
MKKSIFVVLLLLTNLFPAYSQSPEEFIIGTRHQIFSNVLEEERSYWVSLPQSYHSPYSSYKEYPILIILDGNAFFRHISGMVDFMSADSYRNRRIPEMIVVAVENVNRNRDFTPDKIITRRPNDFGGGDNFLRFLEEELIPEIDQEYRTIPYRILFGHSLGGLLATHAYMKENTLFNAFIAADPSLGSWDAETMDQKLEKLTQNSFDRFIYIATANWGKRNIRNRDRHVRLYESFHAKSEVEFPGELEYFEDENHALVPSIAFYKGISSVFEGYGIDYREIQNVDQLHKHFSILSDRLSFQFLPTEALVNQLGYSFLRRNDETEKRKAIEFFQLNTKNYPRSYNAFDSLAEAFEGVGDTDKAIINYQKSLELNPNNSHASERIATLEASKN